MSNENGWQHIDPALARRASALLRELSLLSYAPTQNFKSSGTGKHKNESQPPPYCESLYEKFIGPVSHAFHNEDGEKLDSLCDQIETIIARYRGQYKAEVKLPTDDKDAMKKVCEVFIGDDPVEVSRKLAGQVSPGWVEKARIRNRRKVEDGSKLEGWRGLTDEEQKKKIEHARAHRWTIRQTSENYGVARSTLHDRYGWA